LLSVSGAAPVTMRIQSDLERQLPKLLCL
jgi:hypothetical protein